MAINIAGPKGGRCIIDPLYHPKNMGPSVQAQTSSFSGFVGYKFEDPQRQILGT